MVLGNAAISYPIGRLGYWLAQCRGQAGLALFFFWVTVASVGNFFDYVPIRTVDGGISDMHWIEHGFGWSSWTTLLLFGLPGSVAMADLLLKFTPDAMVSLFPRSYTRRGGAALICVHLIFGFYGAGGLSEGGPVSQRLSRISIFILAPIGAAAVSWLTRHRTLDPSAQLKRRRRR